MVLLSIWLKTTSHWDDLVRFTALGSCASSKHCLLSVSFDNGWEWYRVHVGTCGVQPASNVDLKPCLFVDILIYPQQLRLAGGWVIVMHISKTDVSINAKAEGSRSSESTEDSIAVDGFTAPRPWFLINLVVIDDKLQQTFADAFRALTNQCRIANETTLLFTTKHTPTTGHFPQF